MKRKTILIVILVAGTVFLLSSCNLPQSDAGEVDNVNTAVALTVTANAQGQDGPGPTHTPPGVSATTSWKKSER